MSEQMVKLIIDKLYLFRIKLRKKKLFEEADEIRYLLELMGEDVISRDNEKLGSIR